MKLGSVRWLCCWLLLCLAATGVLAQADAGREAGLDLAEGRYAEAEAIYRRLLRTEPQSEQLLTNLGISLSVQGRFDEAATQFELALRIRYLPKVFVLLARSRCDAGEFAAARPMLAKISEEDRSRLDLLQVIAPCTLDAGDPLDAVSVYEDLASDPAFVSDVVLVQLTRAYLQSAQYFFGRLNAAPDKAPYVEALRAAREGKAGDARGAFAQAAQSSRLFRADANFEAAVAAWQHARNDTALLYQLCVLSGEGSIESFARASAAYPKSPSVRQLEAEMLADQGRPTEAIAAYRELLQTAPELPRLREELGTLYVQTESWPEALTIFKEQLRLHPDDRQAAARVSQSLLALERYEDLRAFLLPRATAPHPSLWMHLDLATAMQKLGDAPGATAQLIAAEKQFPKEKSVHYRLMRLYAAAGNTEASDRESEMFHALK